MYPKSTFSLKEQNIAAIKTEPNEIIKTESFEYTHLIFDTTSSPVYQFVDINMPYIIIYESIDPKNNRTVYQEYSENNQILFNNTYEAVIHQDRKLHSHSFYELTFVLSGELTLKIEDEEIIYRQGDCCLCNKNIHHLEYADKKAEIVLFLMKEEYIHDLCDNNIFYDRRRLSYLTENIFDVFISENRKNPLYDAKIYSDFRSIHPQSFDKAVWLTNQMIEEITGMLSGKNYMMKALFCRFFELMQNKELYRESIYYAKLSNEEQIICRIADAYKNKRGIFTREEIENLTGYNGDYVERIMKRSTGKTLIEFGHDYIIQLAADLLRTTDNSIGSICEELGYSNRHYFNQLFKKKFGVMPSAFRKKD